MMICRVISISRIKKEAARLSVLLLSVFTITHSAHSQNLPPYQELSIRHICEATSVMATPGKSPAHMLKSGEEVRIKDVTFGADNLPYFAVDYATGTGLQRATGFVPVEKISHFCDFTKRSDSGHNFLAPTNTCHLIAIKTDTLTALNKQAVALKEYRPSMAAYRLADGQYALSLGLLNIRASGNIMGRASNLPENSECSTGTEFIEALVKNEKEFSDGEYGNFASASDRLAAARNLMEQTGDANNLKKACDLGLNEACSRYAEAIYNIEDPDGTLPAKVTHYAMMGCMGGDIRGCQLAINRTDNTLENAQFRAVEGGTGNAEDLVLPELAKPGCDAGQAVSCILLARGTATYTKPTLAEAASNFTAKLTACRSGIAWACEEVPDAFGYVVQARGEYTSATADENYSLGSLTEEICTPGPKQPNIVHCKPAYYKYRDFLQANKTPPLTDTRIAKAKGLLERGCIAGDPAACAVQSKLADHWSAEDRNMAAARATKLCTGQSDKDSICDSLGVALDPNLETAKPAQRTLYDTLVMTCMTDKTSNGPQACSAAVSAYASLESTDQVHNIETMLANACNNENINGCQTLASLIATKAQNNPETNQSPEENKSVTLLSVLRTGCRFDDNPASTCLSLADSLSSAGEVNAAMDVYTKTCGYQVTHANERLADVRICYDAAKFALSQKTRYASALQWSEFACNSADLGLSPYACKLAGNIYASGLGIEADLQKAAIAYRNGCFHPYMKTTDGEACLKYGNMLLEAHDNPDSAASVTPDDLQNSGDMISEASRAYDMGCMDNIEQACQANRKLLTDWSKGLYSHNRVQCRVEDDRGSVYSDKICREFSFYQADGQLKEERRQIRLEVYVWPDGDRSVVYQRDGTWLLNEVTTAGLRHVDATKCWRNPVSKRSFCVSPLQE